MDRRLTLFQKGLFLATVPFIFTLVFVILLGSLQIKAEREFSRAHEFQTETNAVNKLLADIYSIELMTSGLAKLDFNALSKCLATLRGDIEQVQKLLADDAEDRAVISQAKVGINEAVALLNEYEERFINEGSHLSPEFKEQGRHRQIAAVRKIFALVPLIKKHQEVNNQRPQYEVQLEAEVQNILIGGLVISIATSLVIAVLVSRKLTGRLSVLIDNSLRLASEVPLRPRIGGSDEIADLDDMFRAMASSLEESTRKERTLIANAADLICSIDSNGRFSAVNQASKRMLGYSPEDLIGTYYVDLVPTENALDTLDCFNRAVTESNAPPFESRLRTKTDSIIDVRWSVHWSSLEQSTFCVLHNISERKAMLRAKQEVVTMITHDLRAPLTTIQHVLEMLRQGSIGVLDQKGQQMCCASEQSAGRMLSLINDLLDIEKIKAGMMQLQLSDVSLTSIFEQSAHSVMGFAEDNQVGLEMESTQLSVRVDHDRIVQVLVNLLSNAVKFSPPQSTIKVSSKEVNSMVEISVKDEGRGIPPEMLTSVFERFQQVQRSDSMHKGGTGLGLAICKEIVVLHGGTMRIESEVGKGSTFAFSLPASSKGRCCDPN